MPELLPPNPATLNNTLPAPEMKPPIYEPTPEELAAGYVLSPDGIVAIDVTPDRTGAVRRRAFTSPNGIVVEGTAVAEMRLGGHETFATGLVINTFDSRDRQESTILITSPNESFAIPLKRGFMTDIGRKFDRQDRLPDTVSGDHCAVGLDESGRLLIENHRPTNATSIRKFGL